MGATARRYAQALFAAASGQNAIDAVLDELAALDAALANPETRTVALSPEVPSSVRRRALAKLTAHAHVLVRNLVQVLIERRRESVLLELEPAFRALVQAARGELTGVIETARPLGDQEVAAIQRTVGNLLQQSLGRHFQKTVLSVAVNPDLIGGVRVRVGNTLFDRSLRSALEELNERLLGAQIGTA